MATQETRGAEGPGNKVIATTLLEALAVRGRSVAAERAARALEAQGTELAAAPTWLADDAIPTLFAAACASWSGCQNHWREGPSPTAHPSPSAGTKRPRPPAVDRHAVVFAHSYLRAARAM